MVWTQVLMCALVAAAPWDVGSGGVGTASINHHAAADPFFSLSPLASLLLQVYVWGRRHQYVNLSFLGIFTFTAPYLPWVLLAFSGLRRQGAAAACSCSVSCVADGLCGWPPALADLATKPPPSASATTADLLISWPPAIFPLPAVMLGSSPLVDLLGMVAGHAYYFLEDVYPRMTGRRLLKTPAVVRALFPAQAIQAPRMAAAGGGGFGGPAAGEQQQQQQAAVVAGDGGDDRPHVD